ncbi:LLM class flavin-dependent oxidoreductase [Tsukamurella ocularis]|uniref:LLM class flavin-dependent oxidoreductase n=1 Tax=Tsukamurella ocularis TaxID=1970234 RepID=UPI0039F138AF
MRISIGVSNPSFPDGPVHGLTRIATQADDSAIDTLWLPDHLVQVDPTAPPGDVAHLEAYTALGWLAARTDRIRLGAMVSPAPFREPAVLVAAVTTLAVLSAGRAWLGLGAGHHAGEATDLGLPFPAVASRMDRTEDALRLARRIWAGDERPFRGRTIDMERPRLSPLPAVPPPILVGGAGEKRTLKLVARYADACNVFDLPDDGRTVRHKLDVLAGHCAAVGRSPREIQVTLSSRLGPDETADELVARARQAAGWGIDHLILVTSAPWTTANVSVVARACDRIADVRVRPWWAGLASEDSEG